MKRAVPRTACSAIIPNARASGLHTSRLRRGGQLPTSNLQPPTSNLPSGIVVASFVCLEGMFMPEKETLKRARADKRAGKAPSTQAGEFVREEIHHVREGKHGARSAKQAIAIGLSKARRAGVSLPRPPASAKASTKRSAKSASRAGRRGKRPSGRRSAGVRRALKREGRSAASQKALSRQAKQAAQRRSRSSRSAAARRGARTKGAKGRKAAARRAAHTRQRRRTTRRRRASA
jgi:Family of unknown function (DUF6496)